MVGSPCFPVSLWHTLGVLRILISAIHSRWTQVFFGVVGVTIPGWDSRLQGGRETSFCFNPSYTRNITKNYNKRFLIYLV